MSRITTTVVTLLLTTAAFGQAKDDAGDGKKLDKQTMENKGLSAGNPRNDPG